MAFLNELMRESGACSREAVEDLSVWSGFVDQAASALTKNAGKKSICRANPVCMTVLYQCAVVRQD